MLRRCVVAVLLSVAITTSAGPARAGYINGEEYLYMEDAERTEYVMGLFDMLEELARDDPRHGAFFNRVERCTAGMSGGQLRDFVDDYTWSDETFEGYSMASNFSAALNSRCPY